VLQRAGFQTTTLFASLAHVLLSHPDADTLRVTAPQTRCWAFSTHGRSAGQLRYNPPVVLSNRLHAIKHACGHGPCISHQQLPVGARLRMTRTAYVASRAQCTFTHKLSAYHLQVLGVKSTADTNEIQRAYKAKMWETKADPESRKKIEEAHSRIMMFALTARLKVVHRAAAGCTLSGCRTRQQPTQHLRAGWQHCPIGNQIC
jgi:hypothetical protein